MTPFTTPEDMKANAIFLLILLNCGASLAQTRKPLPIPQVQIVGEGAVWRISDSKDEDGHYLPPWKEIQITNVLDFKQQPIVGEKVTVIPLDVNIAALGLRVVKAEKQDNACDETMPARWEIELEPIRQRKILDIAPAPDRALDHPFDVCVIYPSVLFAHQVKRNRLTQNMLPKGVAIKTVTAAVDLTNDGIPDVLMVEYCCGNPKKTPKDCDYTCGKTFKKTRSGWKLIDSYTPC